MDPEGFLRSLGDLSAMEPDDPVDALVARYNSELSRAIDMIAPKRPLSLRGVVPAPWFTGELAEMKCARRRLECLWRTTRDASDRARSRAAIRAYSAALRAARKAFSQFLGKVLERVVASQLQGFLDDTDFLDQSQSGFRPGFSTEMALVALVDDLRRELDRGSVTLLVLLDISAAFDTIDHGILLGRLSGMGLGGTVLQSFLDGRSQMVKLGDTCSDPWPLSCGVPQGSILYPMLFNIYKKPLGEVIRGFGVRCHLYADDTQLYYSFPPKSKEAPRILDQCLAAVFAWMRVNKLRLNPDKTEVLQVSRKSDRGIGWQPVLDGVTLPLKAQVRSLGVLLNSGLTLEAQVSAVAGRAFAQLKLVRQLRPYLEKSDLTMVVHALVTSRLDYCNALCVGLPLKTVRKLQLVQSTAARFLTGANYRARSTPLFKELHWLPLTF
uniref:Reverse transcriptase domain-containing protein n=1 Tax=Anolis carolinensis TaxID=28377 RepID=A0A803SSM3_ANOCA